MNLISTQPSLTFASGPSGSYKGRYIHYGIREHAMAAIANGLAAFVQGAILPVTSSFFMFYLYAAPAVRMGALQHLQVLHIATHDSIGTGEDGPTHQPIELAALYRAMPNMLYMRPCDSEEVAGCVAMAVKNKHGPSILSLSRQNLPQWPGHSQRAMVEKGAYVFQRIPATMTKADLVVIGVGAEMEFAAGAANELARSLSIAVQLVSFPCTRLFDAQPASYKASVLPPGVPTVVVEAYSSNGWERYADAAVCMRSFGKSLPGKDAYKYFGFESSVMASRIRAWLLRRGKGEAGHGRWSFDEL